MELFATTAALQRHPRLVHAARSTAVTVDEISERAAAALSETTTPQGLIAVCRFLDRPLDEILTARPPLVVALVGANDPGNAGTVLRSADAAGAAAVVFAGDSVDPYNGKVVRASAGSLFHLDVVNEASPPELITAARAAGYRVLATAGAAAVCLDDLDLSGPTLWLFGNEANGLPEDVLAAADTPVRIPIYGRAESLNLAAAATVCLYASARAQRGR